MVRAVAVIAQVTLISLILYNALTAAWGWRERRPAPPGARDRRLRVLVPAHDEARVIAGVIADLRSADYPARLVDLWVVADRCHDDTVPVAEAAGAQVHERHEGRPGKGPAIQWHLQQRPLRPDEALVVFDADNRVPRDALARVADELDAGHTVVQCYLDATNPGASPLSEASALSYWAGNRMVQLARSNLGWSADLGGTGMAITESALEAAGGFSDTLTEDQDLGVRLLLAGHRVEWVHDVRIADEKPTTMGVTMRQRARWMAGKRMARRRHLGRLVARPTPARVDMALRLVQPGRSFVALISAGLTAAAVAEPTSWLLPWPVWATVTALQFLQPIPYLVREGVEPRRLVRYPLLALLAALWLPIRLLSARVQGWYHTPHTGEVTSSDREQGLGP